MQETKLTTAEEFAAMGEGSRELIRGEVVEMNSPRPRHGRIGALILVRVAVLVESKKLGVVYNGETGFLLERDPDTVRAPDVAFVSAERLVGLDEREYFPFAPDLVVEVVSPSDSFIRVEEKAAMWVKYGSRLVWVVEPDLRKVFVYRPDAPREELSADDELTGGDVLPGLVIPLAEVF